MQYTSPTFLALSPPTGPEPLPRNRRVAPQRVLNEPPRGRLTAKGEHRSAGPVDLLVAAAAKEAGLTLLHCDHDFDTIARTTGQPVRTMDLRQ